MRSMIAFIAILVVLSTSCGPKDTVIHYSGFDSGAPGEDSAEEVTGPGEDAPPGVDILEGTRYLIILKEDTAQPLELIVGDHYPVKGTCPGDTVVDSAAVGGPTRRGASSSAAARRSSSRDGSVRVAGRPRCTPGG